MRRPKAIVRKHSKGQVDHIDAWLISYADMITLLFIVVVIAIPVTMNKNNSNPDAPRGEPEHPYYQSDHTGLLSINTLYDESYREISGLIISSNEDEDIAVDKTEHGLWLDISVPLIFEMGTADIKPEQVPLLKTILNTIKNTMPDNSILEVAGYTDDAPLESSKFSNNWELSSMQTARVASLLIDSGIDPKIIHITSYAGNAPIVPNLDASGKPILKNRVRNQRIMIKVEMAQAKLAGS